MKRFFLAILAAVMLPGAGAGAQELTPTEIVRRCDDLLRGEESYCQLAMTINRPTWTRAVVMDAWTRGTEESFLRVLSPPKEKGSTFLKKQREAWQYAPSIDRIIKIPPSMMLQSWLGSDFTNDDVVRADSIIVDYTHAILREISEQGVDCWIIAATPKPDAPVVWGRIELQIRKPDFIAVRVDYYDEEGQRVKTYETADYTEVEGRRLALRMVMHDLTRPGHRTEIVYSRLTFKPALPPDIFSQQNLRR